MAATLKASAIGLRIIDAARREKGWGKYEKAWYEQAVTSGATLKRFWAKEPISQEMFKDICETVGISDWRGIVDSPNPYTIDIPTKPVELPSDARIEILHPGQSSVIERIVEISAITENIPEDLQKWLVVYAPGARKWYPNEVLEQGSKWKMSIIVGSVDCYGSDFKISLFITDAQGSNYLKSFSDGTKQMPPGISVEVDVCRAYTPPKTQD